MDTIIGDILQIIGGLLLAFIAFKLSGLLLFWSSTFVTPVTDLIA